MIDTDKILSADEARQYSPLSLAFLGDSVYEEFVRTELVLEANMPPGRLHEKAVQIVCAKFQSKAARYLLESSFTEEEEYIFKRGRNSSTISAPKSAKNSDYRAATGLEAVFGFLALTGRLERAGELYRTIRNNVE